MATRQPTYQVRKIRVKKLVVAEYIAFLCGWSDRYTPWHYKPQFLPDLKPNPDYGISRQEREQERDAVLDLVLRFPKTDWEVVRQCLHDRVINHLDVNDSIANIALLREFY